jgi:hypothetical protein
MVYHSKQRLLPSLHQRILPEENIMWQIFIGPVLAVIFLLYIIAIKDGQHIRIHYHDDPLCPGHLTKVTPESRCGE